MKKTAFSTFVEINHDTVNSEKMEFVGTGFDYSCNGKDCKIKETCINNKMTSSEMLSKCHYLNGLIKLLSKYIIKAEQHVEFTDYNSLMKKWNLEPISDNDLFEAYGNSNFPIVYVKTKCENCTQNETCKELDFETVKAGKGGFCKILEDLLVYDVRENKK